MVNLDYSGCSGTQSIALIKDIDDEKNNRNT